MSLFLHRYILFGIITTICTCRYHTTTDHDFHLDVMSESTQCCICLGALSSPASLPCGHCFCLGCIGEYWRINGACRCPLCMAFFPTRPHLKTDQTQLTDCSSEGATAPFKAGEVPCDFCPAKCRAVKSCLQCMASYCAAHIEPHYRDEDLSQHLLLSVMKNLEDPVCRLHGKQLERFCRSDQTLICTVCAQTEHTGHCIVSIKQEAGKNRVKSERSAPTGGIKCVSCVCIRWHKAERERQLRYSCRGLSLIHSSQLCHAHLK